KKEIVLVYENYKSFINNKYSKTYSFDDEVLTEEFGTEEEIEEMNNQKTSYAPNWNPAYRHFAQGLIDYKIAYHKDGIYYTLVAKIEDNIACVASEINIPRVAFNWKNEKKQSENYPTLTTTESEDGQTCGKFKIRPYAGTRRLTNYSIDADFKATDTSLPPQNDTWAHSY
ncbi:MAG: hypothetical protein JXL97_13360, partial [Bacteroidales bacterium]|nr:hypothetical protein [Bacteroidales bacterium]